MTKPWNGVSLVDYTEREEKLHVITHAAGLILSTFIVVFCLIPAIRQKDIMRIICASLYFFGTTIMFMTSVMYHASKKPERKKFLRLLDHCMIYFAVAGTATGCVATVYETAGKTAAALMASIAWAGALTGLMLTFFSFGKTKALQMCLYIGVGLICAIAGAKAFMVLPRGAFHCLLGGGAFLLLGAALYGVGKKKSYFHAVFHVCIDIGLSIFFLGIKKYCFAF